MSNRGMTHNFERSAGDGAIRDGQLTLEWHHESALQKLQKLCKSQPRFAVCTTLTVLSGRNTIEV